MKRSVYLLHHGFLCSHLLFRRLFCVVLAIVPYVVHGMNGGRSQPEPTLSQDAVALANAGLEATRSQSAQYQVQPSQNMGPHAIQLPYLALLAQQAPFSSGLGQMPGFNPVFNFTVNTTQTSDNKTQQVTEQLQRMMAEQQQQQRHEVTIEQVQSMVAQQITEQIQSQIADLKQVTQQSQRVTQEQKAELTMLQATVSQIQNYMRQAQEQKQKVKVEVEVQPPTSDIFEQFLSGHKWKLGVGLWLVTYSEIYKKLTHHEEVSQKPGCYTAFTRAVYASVMRMYRQCKIAMSKLFYKKHSSKTRSRVRSKSSRPNLKRY